MLNGKEIREEVLEIFEIHNKDYILSEVIEDFIELIDVVQQKAYDEGFEEGFDSGFKSR